MYFGVYFGDQRGFVFCMGRRRSQTLVFFTYGFNSVWVSFAYGGHQFALC